MMVYDAGWVDNWLLYHLQLKIEYHSNTGWEIGLMWGQRAMVALKALGLKSAS